MVYKVVPKSESGNTGEDLRELLTVSKFGELLQVLYSMVMVVVTVTNSF